MRILFFTIVFACAFNSYAQTSSNIVLDSLSFTMVNVQDSYDSSPFPEEHPQYKEPTIDLVISFTISNLNNLKQVNVVFEKEKGKKNFKVFQLQYVVSDAKSYLTIGNRFYSIENGKAVIREQINAELMRRKIYFSVSAIDKQNLISNTLTRDFN